MEVRPTTTTVSPPAAAASTTTTATTTTTLPSIAYIQLGVPIYRISRMIQSNADITSAYGFVNTISPINIPFRAINGIRVDPFMFVAVNCLDVEGCREFYEGIIGMGRAEYVASEIYVPS